MKLMKGSTDINNIKEEQIEKANELIESIKELEANIKELSKYNQETKSNQLRQWQIISKIVARNSKQMVLYVQRKRNII